MPNGTASFIGSAPSTAAQGQQFTLQAAADAGTVLLAVCRSEPDAVSVFE
jgi:hypothetical protein